ncbi:hypothetical protein HII28_16160 [Planctomonas sp. JC2975]|nr:hypothetical protein [Planctomonas sp. JC2975]
MERSTRPDGKVLPISVGVAARIWSVVLLCCSLPISVTEANRIAEQEVVNGRRDSLTDRQRLAEFRQLELAGL